MVWGQNGGLREFFDKNQKLESDARDRLSYERLSDSGSLESTGYEGNSFETETGSFNCQTASDCGADHSCSGGQCVPNNSTSTTAAGDGASPGGSSSGGGSPSAGCSGDIPGNDCIEKGCATGPTCGDGGEEPFGCCGTPIYRCHGAGQTGEPQCEPCEFEDKECNDFCDSWFKSHGSLAPNCTSGATGRPLTCGDCSECFTSLCREADDGPCWCKPGNTGCPDCEECQRPSGDCKAGVGVCNDECNCFVTCPCGTQYQGFHTQEHYATGLACPSACRAATYQKYCVEGKDKSCPPQKDPCKADPGNKCELDCYCTSQKVSCNGTHTCPDGYRCQVTGTLNASLGGQCEDGTDPANLWATGGKTIFLRICKMGDDPDCQECDCNCENDCPDCFTCGANGQCVYDPACDQPCDVPCNGACCGPGQKCVPAVLWQVIDACHFQGATFAAPQGVTPALVHTTDVTKEDAVCDRWHTHCAVTVQGGQVAQHLDCQKGLKRIGPAGYNICSD